MIFIATYSRCFPWPKSDFFPFDMSCDNSFLSHSECYSALDKERLEAVGVGGVFLNVYGVKVNVDDLSLSVSSLLLLFVQA